MLKSNLCDYGNAYILFDQPIKNDLKTYNNIRKTSVVQEDSYTTGCLLVYWLFSHRFK